MICYCIGANIPYGYPRFHFLDCSQLFLNTLSCYMKGQNDYNMIITYNTYYNMNEGTERNILSTDYCFYL